MVAEIWGQTRNLDNRTIAPPELPKRRSYGRGRLRNPDMGTDTMSDMPVRNVQRETFNSQPSMGCPKGRMVAAIWGQTRNLDNRTFNPVDLTKRRPGGRGGLGAQIWGQARCPVYRSGTFNVKRSTLNFQRGDRKGAWWAGYGDRHGIWATGLLTQRT